MKVRKLPFKRVRIGRKPRVVTRTGEVLGRIGSVEDVIASNGLAADIRIDSNVIATVEDEMIADYTRVDSEGFGI